MPAIIFLPCLSFQFVHGSPASALNEPNTAVISVELAQKLFPDENPIGKVIYSKRYGEYAYEIIGVAKSRETSYFDFNAVLSFSTLDYNETHVGAWGGSMFNTFALLEKDSSIEKLNQQLKAFVKRHYGEESKRTFFAQKMTSFYLSELDSSEGFRGQWAYIYLFGSVAIFILLLACINYINLSTARAAKRAREVGVRKTAGASRAQIISQFIGESVLLCGNAYLIGLLLAWFALPFFNTLFGMSLTFAEAGFNWFLILAAVTLGVGFLAGSYPAFYLSAFKPTQILKGHSNQGRSESWLRNGLVTMQFVVAAVLIIGTIVVFRQLQFTQQKDLGFEGEQVVVTNIPSDSDEAFRQEVVANSNVISATVTNGIPGRFGMTLGYHAKSVSSEAGADTSESIRFHPAVVDYNYIETLGMELVAGRQFSEERPSDFESSYIITETAAAGMGWKVEEAIGKPFDLGKPGKVIGVVKDFHIYSFHKPIEPVTLQLYEAESWSSSKVIAARLAPGAIQAGIRHIEEVYKKITDEAFEYTFLDDEFAEMYREEQRLEKVFGVFSIIAVVLACMGLFGLAAFAAERRTKEIGIRKVLGATVPNVVGLLSKDFLKLALLGFIIAIPIAWYAMNRWLQDFAYKIEIGPGIFLMAGIGAVLIALATVSWQSIRAALANPVDSLRSE